MIQPDKRYAQFERLLRIHDILKGVNGGRTVARVAAILAVMGDESANVRLVTRDLRLLRKCGLARVTGERWYSHRGRTKQIAAAKKAAKSVPRFKGATERRERLLALRASGMTLVEIAAQEGVTHARISQIIK